jgi:hypothetical protein
MAFFNNLFNSVKSRRDAPALQKQVLPQVTPQQLTGIGSMLPMQTITLPGGQTVQIPQLNMNEINANLLASGITPQTPLPQDMGALDKDGNLLGLPATTPSLPVAPPSLPVAAPITTGYNDGNNAVTGDFNPYERVTGATNPVYTPPPLPVAAPAVENVNPFQGGFTGVENSTFGPMIPMTPEEKAASDASFRELMETQDDQYFENYYNLDRGPISTDLPGGGKQIAAQERFDFGELTPKQYYMQDKYGVDPMASTAPVDTVGAGFDPTQGGTLTPAVEQPLAPYTGAGQTESPNYIPTIQRNETGMDALTQQLLFGLDGQGGFIPGAMRAAEKTFFNPDGTPRVVEERRADFTADQLGGMDLARRNVGIQDPFLTGAESSFRQGVTDIGQGIERGRGFQQRGLQELQSGIGNLQGELGGVEGIARGAAGNFGTQLGGIAGRGIGATDRFGRRI